MIIEKITISFVAIVLIALLSVRYIKRYAPENLIIIPLMALFGGMYIFFTVNNIYIPIYLQILIFLFDIFVPIIATFLQYNNIVLTHKILYYKMKYAYISKEYKKTIDYIAKLVSYEGRKAEYLYILGQCYKNINDFINARDSFALAIELDKNDYKSYYELGLILDETNKKETALAMFNRAIKIKPDFYEAREAMGICLTRQGRFKEAVSVYRKALEKFPNSYELYYNIAIIEMELGEYDSAKEAFENAGRIKPDLYTAFYNLGNINYAKGDYDTAIEDYKKILTSGLYGKKAYYKIAIVYATKKEFEKAMSALEYAIELEPKYISNIKDEYAFKPMEELINKYLQDREVLKAKEKDRRNYMKDRFKLFKKQDDLDVESMDYSKKYSDINNYTKKEEIIKQA